MSSTDATPDNSPPNSPPGLPPPKAKRQAARPRKPRPPKEVIVKVKAPAPAVTKRRTATTAQPRKKVPKDEKPFLETVPKKRRAPKTATATALPRQQVQWKRVPDPQETTDSDRELELSFPEEERKIALQVARRRLEDLVEETTMLADELQKEEDDVQRLLDEKLRLLDELLVLEGLAVNPYPPFRPALLTKKSKRGRR